MTGQELVNALLDHLRDEHGLTSDEQLTKILDVSDTQIWRWRDGQLGKIGRILLPLVYQHHDAIAADLVEV